MVWLHVKRSPNTFSPGSVPPCILPISEVLPYCAALWGPVLAKALTMELETFAKYVFSSYYKKL